MGKSSKTKKSPAESTEPKKTRRARTTKPVLDSMLATLGRIAATFARAASAEDKMSKLKARLESWNVTPGDSAYTLYTQINDMKASGFVPPKSTRGSKVEFAEGQTVALKDEFATPYLSLYSEEEIHSLKFSFFDPVNKVAMLESDGRFVAAKMKHLEARA